MNNSDVIMTLGPSTPRRWFGVSTQAALGAFLLFLAASGDANLLLQAMFLLAGLLALWGAYRMWQVTDVQIELTKEELRTDKGHILTKVENIRSVERGAFAFKPSNGFLVRLKSPAGTGWAPGVWWKRGRLLGIGGTIPGGQSRAMADMLATLISDRDSGVL